MKRMTFLLLVSLFWGTLWAQQKGVRCVRSGRVEITSDWDVKVDSTAAEILAPYRQQVDSVAGPVLGMSRVAMDVRRPESPLSNWAADVLVETSTATGLPRADVGLINMGGLRSNMPRGIVRRGDIMLISPFDNQVVVVEVTGKQLMRLFHNIAEIRGQGVSDGVRMRISPEGELLEVTLQGEPVLPKRIYRVATIDYLAEGNDNMTALRKHKRVYPLDILLREAMMESIIKNRIIDSKVEGRVVLVQHVNL